ncbi:MAG: hypothetical protein HUK18_05660 [Bacteroidales bacterium]|nr:hypothetical protein [Bacteroidales bacterium]
MKIKTVPTIIAAALSALIAFGFYFWCATEENQLLFAIGVFIVLFLSFGLSFCVKFEGRTTTSIVAVGILSSIVFLGLNTVFCFVKFGVPAFVIANGIVLLLMLLITYTVAKAKQ